jgi:hypothetical protein
MISACFKVDFDVKHEQSIYEEPNHAGKVFLSKKPHDILWAEPVLRRLNDLFIIYMLRDPRDVVVSKHNYDPERYWVGLNLWKCYTPLADRLDANPRFIVIRYENLVRYPALVQSHLLDRIPFLRQTAPFSAFHEFATPSDDAITALGGVRRPSVQSIGRWRGHASRIAGQLIRHGAISHELITYGYEWNSDWEVELTDVTPDMSESHHPESWGLEEIIRSYISRFDHKHQQVMWQTLSMDCTYVLDLGRKYLEDRRTNASS